MTTRRRWPTDTGTVLVRGYVGQVVISCGPEVIARHPRSYEKDDFVFDPIHYLPLLERKTAALDQAAPLFRGGIYPRSTGRCAACWRPGWEGGATGIRPGAPAHGNLLHQEVAGRLPTYPAIRAQAGSA